jgi:hypothetical protein
MSEETQNDVTTDNTETTSESVTPAEAQKPENMIPQSRFNEINNRNKELIARLDAIEKERKDAEIAQLAADNRYQELYEKTQATVEPLQKQADEAERYRNALTAGNAARLNRIPEDKQNRIPPIDDPIIMGQWLDANADLYTDPVKPTAPSLDGGSGQVGKTAPAISAKHESLADVAASLGYDVDKSRIAEYAKNMKSNK